MRIPGVILGALLGCGARSAAQDEELVPVTPVAAYRLGDAGVLVAGTLYRAEEAEVLKELRRVPRPAAPPEPTKSLIARHLERAAAEGWAPHAYLESDWIPAADLARMAAHSGRAFEFTAAWSGSDHDRPARYAVVKTRADYEALVAKLTDDDRERREAKEFSSTWVEGSRVGFSSEKDLVASTSVADAVGQAAPSGFFRHTALKAGFQAHASAFLTGQFLGFAAVDTSKADVKVGGLATLFAGARAYASDAKREALASLLRADTNSITPVRRAAAFALADHLLRRYRDRLKGLCTALARTTFTEDGKPKRNEPLVAAFDEALREALGKDLAALEKELVESVLTNYALSEEKVAELSGLAAEWGAAKTATFAKLARGYRDRKLLWASDTREWRSMKAELDKKLLSLKVNF